MSQENHGNVSLPSFQSFFHGQDLNRHNNCQSDNQSLTSLQQSEYPYNTPPADIPNSYYNPVASSSALDLSCTASEPKSIYKSYMTEQSEPHSDKQSLYYKECLPSFANFMNFPQIQKDGVEGLGIKKEEKTYESCHQSSNHENDNFYSHKLNEMSQFWKNPIKSEDIHTTNHGSVYPSNTASHPMYSQYNPYQMMNNMSPSNLYQYYNQQSYQQYSMYPNNVKTEEMNNKLFQGPNEVDTDYNDLDPAILKRKKQSSTSKRAKKMRGDIEDCNYELCNMWDEIAPSANTSSQHIKDDIKSESNSCDSESYQSNDTLSSNSRKDSMPEVSKPVTIFNFIADDTISSKCRSFLESERRLCQHLKMISFGEPVSHIYNPLVYAFETHLKFLKTFCTTDKTVLFLAMNPGPFGMSQNGVPFGEVSAVRDWFRIRGNVQKPAREHPKRCITGLDCHRSEVSGGRFWGFFRKVCGTPEVFFRHCFVHNLCPLAFMSPTGRNITPPELRADQRNALNQACDMALVETLDILQVKIIICIGKFVESRVQSVLKSQGKNNIRVERITHPSPINPAANKGWDDTVYQQLKDLGILSYFTRED